MQKLETKSCEEIMTTVYKPIEFVVEGLIAQGLYLLAGAPKVGKSWLALDMCLSIAKGEKILGQKATQGVTLYLCLEDSYERIQKRLYELTDEPTENLYFAIMADTIGSGLEIQIEKFKSEHTDLKLVVIDTLQKIRESAEKSYGSDYKKLSSLKSLDDKLAITIVLVHHTRKCKDSDPFNMISGSTGISGCVDGSMVLVEKKRGHCPENDTLVYVTIKSLGFPKSNIINRIYMNLCCIKKRYSYIIIFNHKREFRATEKNSIRIIGVYVFINYRKHFVLIIRHYNSVFEIGIN